MTSQPQHQPKFIKKSQWWRVLKYILLCVSLLFIVATLASYFLITPFVKHQLEKSVKNATDGLYELEIQQLIITFLPGSIHAKNVSLRLDSSYYHWLRQQGKEVAPTQVQLVAEELLLNNIRWMEYLTDKKIRVGELFFMQPHFTILTDNRLVKEKREDIQADSVSTLSESSLERPIPAIIHAFASAIQVDTLNISNGSFTFDVITKKGKSHQEADSIYVAFLELTIDSTAATAWNRLLFAKDVSLNFRNYKWVSSEGLYQFSMDKVDAFSELNLLRIEGIALQTLVSDNEFSRRKGFQTDRYNFSTALINCYDLDFKRLVKGEVAIQAIHTSDIKLDIYRDKRLPNRQQKNPLVPHEAFKLINFHVQVDTVNIRNAFIKYSERISKKPSLITFEKTDVLLLNFTNDKQLMTKESPALIKGKTLLMGQGLLTLEMAIPLLSEDLELVYKGRLGKMRIPVLNKMLAPSERMRIEDGTIDEVIFEVKVDQGVANGLLQATYEDLKVKILHKGKNKKRKLLSFFGNLLIKNKNKSKKKQPPRKGRIQYTRQESDGFPRFLWVSLREGLLDTVFSSKVKEITVKK